MEPKAIDQAVLDKLYELNLDHEGKFIIVQPTIDALAARGISASQVNDSLEVLKSKYQLEEDDKRNYSISFRSSTVCAIAKGRGVDIDGLSCKAAKMILDAPKDQCSVDDIGRELGIGKLHLWAIMAEFRDHGHVSWPRVQSDTMYIVIVKNRPVFARWLSDNCG